LNVLDDIDMEATLPHHTKLDRNYDWKKFFNVWSLGISLIIESLYSDWNAGLEISFVPLFLATLMFGTAYTALMLCIGEIVSGLPFNGGAFGVVRCTIGLFPGFLAGCAEAVYYIIFTAQSVVYLSEIAADLVSFPPKYSPIVWLFFYFIMYGILSRPYLFWKLSNAIAVFCVALMSIYCFGSLPILHRPPSLCGSFDGTSGVKFLKSLPNASYFFIGIESLALTCTAKSAQRNIIAHACLFCVLTFFGFTLMTLGVAFSLGDPKTLPSEAFPLNNGLVASLHCTSNQAVILTLPGEIGCLYAFACAYGKLICALSESRLLPATFSKKNAAGCPCKAIIFGSVLSYFLCFLITFNSIFNEIASQFCFVAAFVMYGLFCVGYIIIKKKYAKSIMFPFQSPLGVLGAGYVVVVFVLGTISVLFFQNDAGAGLISIAVFFLFASMYYFTVARYRQEFSVEEQQCVVKLPEIHTRIKSHKEFSSRIRRISRICVAASKQPHENEVALEQTLYGNGNTGVPISPKWASSYLQTRMNTYMVHTMLGNQAQAAELRQKAAALFCEENVDFCRETIQYKQKAEEILGRGFLYDNLENLHSSYLQIVEQFIGDDSPNQVNISCKQRVDILNVRNFKDFVLLHPLRIVTIFDEASREIELVLCNNIN